MLYFKNFFSVWIVLLFWLWSIGAAMAQDTIVKRNDEKIIAKILEVNPTDIKFKRFDYQDGPTFTLDKSDLKYIVYHNALMESFENYKSPAAAVIPVPLKKDLSIQPAGKYYFYQSQKITEQDALDIIWKQQDKKMKLIVKKTEELKVLKNSFFVGGIVLGSAGLLTFVGAFDPSTSAVMGSKQAHAQRLALRPQNHRIGGYLLAGALTAEIISYVFKIREVRHAHMAVDIYNQTITTSQ